MSSTEWAFLRFLYMFIISSSFIEFSFLRRRFWCHSTFIFHHFCKNSLIKFFPCSLFIISFAIIFTSACKRVLVWQDAQWILISTHWLVIPVRKIHCSSAFDWQCGQTKLERVLSMMPRRNVYCIERVYKKSTNFANMTWFFGLTFLFRVYMPVQMLKGNMLLKRVQFSVARESDHFSFMIL